MNGIDYDGLGSKNFQALIVSEISDLGEIKKEVEVGDRGDGRCGRIDLVLKGSDGLTYAFELDRSCKRKKSVFKLTHYPADKRYCILRSPFTIIEI